MRKNAQLTLFSKFPISPHTKFCIVIPVKDEEEYIFNTLSAFNDQQNIDSSILDQNTFEILVLANNCTDRSVEIIKNFQKTNPQLNIYLDEICLMKEQANIGYVRKILMETAFLRLYHNAGGIILTTDGDSTVSQKWIAQNNLEIQNGADAVGGRILFYPQEIDNMDQFAYDFYVKDERYQLLLAKLETIILKKEGDPNPRHHQHFNGSFAITTHCYSKSGGLPDVEHLEDMAFYEKLNLIDARVRHSNKVIVHTSARFAGRTEIGLSNQLTEWKNRGNLSEKFIVESANSTIGKLLIKRKMLDLWENKDLSEDDFIEKFVKIFPIFDTDEDHYKIYRFSKYFGEWFALYKVNLYTNIQNPPDYIDNAISALEIDCKTYEDPTFSQTSIR